MAGSARFSWTLALRFTSLKKGALTNLEVVDTEKDFYPYLAEFQTDVYPLTLEIAGENHIMRCGVLPQLLEMALPASGVGGILGTELFDKYIVTFDQQNRCLWLEPNQA
jgi:hypothetical protein